MGTKVARIVGFLRAYTRIIVSSLVFAYAAFLLIHPDEEGRAFDLIFFALLVMLIASQLFWIRRIVDVGERFLPGKPRRAWLGAILGAICLILFLYNLETWNSAAWNSTHVSTALTLRSVLLEAPFWWWFVGSFAGFFLVLAFWTVDRAVGAAAWLYREGRNVTSRRAALKAEKPALVPPSPSRRHFLERAAVLVSATPFVAAGYGLLRGRLDVEVTRQAIRLPRLPKAFEGFRIVQLSDLHISPFMTGERIRRCATIANGLKPDLIVLTGDFLTWDAGAQGEVVQSLVPLHAPYGVFGCLGNHEVYTRTQDSLTRLLSTAGIRILRHATASIRSAGENLNLIGVDFQGCHECPTFPPQDYLRGVEPLVLPDTVNILLSHNPESFDRAAALGIDLSLAGHTHGGQLAMEFVHRGLNLAPLGGYTYTRGWYEKPGGQLYVNRGIGTIGFPIRFGAPPEITLFELTKT
ncbi:MAG TPA: metallophosphoesterase [Terriglobia bacterium]|nr:metallophosphoesterase [Terriglobia bacterium]